ncbi:sodium:proton antiporter [Enterococcus hirae]|nr:sodium:proton antiporter [Enterococcus hirae]
MDSIEMIVAFGLAITISSVISRLVPPIPTPIIQILLGILLGLTPIGHGLVFTPEVFLVMIIAPLLFREGEKANILSFLENSSAILFLAFIGVIVTLLGIGMTVHYLLPMLPLAACFALGAALGPTDAVAVKSLSGGLQFSKKSLTILEGEGLLNDASGVTAFQFALAALVTGGFSVTDAAQTLVFASIGGALIGFLLVWIKGQIVLLIEKASAKDVSTYLLLELLLPFIAYLLAELCHSSGIIAAVVAGVMQSSGFRHFSLFEAKLATVSENTWSTIEFTLNALVFLILGVEVAQVFSPIWEAKEFSNGYLLMVILLLSFLLFLIRFLAISIFFLFKDGWKQTKAHFHDLLVLTFGGVKGTVSLATIFILPLTIHQVPFEWRALLLFLTACVILVTLLVGILVLPRLATDQESEPLDKQEVTILAEVIHILRGEIKDKEKDDKKRLAAEAIIDSYRDRIHEIYLDSFTLETKEESDEILSLMVTIERDSLNEAYHHGRISEAAFRFYQRFVLTINRRIQPVSLRSFLNMMYLSFHRIMWSVTHPRLLLKRFQHKEVQLTSADYDAIRELFRENSQLIFSSLDNLEDVYDSFLLKYFITQRRRLIRRLDQGTFIPLVLVRQEPVYAREVLRGYYLERKAIDEYEVSGKITSWQANEYRQQTNLLESYSLNKLEEEIPWRFAIRKRHFKKQQAKGAGK